MGDVYEAVDEVLGREVAVKTLKGGATGLAARMLDERFRLEARAIAALAHPGVVQVFDIDLNAEPPYLVMERVAGPSLKEQLQNGPLSSSEVRALGIQIGNALAAAHAAKILHRDVKPANILAAGPGRWKLADFGVAHVPDSSLTMTGQFVGSPAYAPPEALVRGQTGTEGDVFGLGATLFQAAAGTWPRADATTGGLLAAVPPLRSIAPNVPQEIANAIDAACAIEPSQRPSAAELAEMLASGVVRASAPAITPPAGSVTVGDRRVSAVTDTVDVRISRAHSAPPVATEYVGDESRPGVPALATIGLPSAPVAARKVPWKAIAIGAGALAILLVIAAASGSDGNKAGTAASNALPVPGATPTETQPAAMPPGRIQATPPATDDPNAIAHWNEIARRIYGADYDAARSLLSDWEDEYGERPETRNLASQLDAVLRDQQQYAPPGRGRGKKKKHRD